jgi:hypothetical protein
MSSLENRDATNRGAIWLEIVRIALAQLVVLLALSGVFVRYVSWSSDATWAEFRAANPPSVPEQKPRPQSSAPVRTANAPKACYLRA